MKHVRIGLLIEDVLGAALHPRNIRRVEDKYLRTLPELVEQVMSVVGGLDSGVSFSDHPSRNYLGACNNMPLEPAEVPGSVKMRKLNEELQYLLEQKENDIKALQWRLSRVRDVMGEDNGT